MAHESWGSGWPNCQSGAINKNFGVDTQWGRVSFPGGVRNELCELVERLVKETSNRGYRFGVDGNPSYGCWGFACRPIAGGNTPSNHSWGLAVDINAPRNPYKDPLTTDMPSWMPDLWNAFGFRWGGDYRGRKDAMHYEFMGSVQECADKTELARQHNLGGSVTPPVTPPKPTAPAFPLPSGHYFGPKSGPSTSHSGYYNNDDDKFRPWQQQMANRGWKIAVDGLYGPQTESVCRSFQAEKGLKVDGLIGAQTWSTAWTSPVT